MSNPQAERLAALKTFAQTALGHTLDAPVAASSDASFRSYWRLADGRHSWIVMDAPPERENLAPFVDIAGRLHAAGLLVPQILAEDRAQGFLLLTDFGDRTYLPELHGDSVDRLYGSALEALLRMQLKVDTDGLPPYDEQRLRAELELLPTWFVQQHLGGWADCAALEAMELAFRRLLESALEQPVAFVHRDFHSRNLMIVGERLDGPPGILDFQDAVRGPLTYDLVSLLKDCYIRWPAERVRDWAEAHRERLRAHGWALPGPTRWRRWFDWIGVQRHLKVLGIFARLNYRDGKPGYLKDLPRVLAHVLETCSRYGELAPLGEWLERITRGVDLTVPRQGRE